MGRNQFCSQRFLYMDEGIEQLLVQMPAEAIFVMEATGTYLCLAQCFCYQANEPCNSGNCNSVSKHVNSTWKPLVRKFFTELYERPLAIPLVGTKAASELIIVANGFIYFGCIKALLLILASA